MSYRVAIPVAIGTAALLGGYFSLSKKRIGTPLIGSNPNDNGLWNYPFVDSKRFELLNATVFIRHGARTPNYFIDSNLNMPDWESGIGYVDLLSELRFDAEIKDLQSKKSIKEETIMDEYLERVKGKSYLAQLTLLGQEQSMSFGKELSRIYMYGHKILTQEFNENEIYCRTTKFPRSYYTMKGVLAGIYGSDAFDLCHKPIIYTMDIKSDSMYPNGQVCSVIDKFIVSGAAEIAKDPEIIKMKCALEGILGVDNLRFTIPGRKSTKHSDSCMNIKNQSAKSKIVQEEDTAIDGDVTVYAVRDDLYSRQTHNFDVPYNFSSLLPELNRLSSQEILYEYMGGSVEWEHRIAFIVSPALNFIKKNMKIVIDNMGASDEKKGCVRDMKESLTKRKHTMKMQLMTCHDITLIPLLLSLRIYDGQWPVFTANLIVELYKEHSSDKLYTRLLYNGKVQKAIITEDSCGPDNEYARIGLMPYTDFIKFADEYSLSEDKYTSSCDKALKLFTAGKPVTKDQFI